MATTIDVTKENGTFYTWDSANFGWNDTQADKTWNNAANTLAAVNVGEPYAISDVMRPNINKRLLESIHVADTMKTSLQILRKDVLSIGETYWDNINFALKIAESFVVNELRKATITAIRKDQINFTEKVIKNDHKYFYEIFATQEAAIRTLNKITKESFHLLESSSQAVTFLRTLAEGLAINEVLNKNVQYTREFAETLSVVQTYWDNIAFALRLMEGIGISEREVNTADFHRTIAESLAIADVMNHTIARLVMILETLGISDFGGRAVDYKRTLAEAVHATEAATQSVDFQRLFAESMALTDYLKRNYNRNVLETLKVGRFQDTMPNLTVNGTFMNGITTWNFSGNVTIDSTLYLRSTQSVKFIAANTNPFIWQNITGNTTHKYYVAGYCYIQSWGGSNLPFLDVRDYNSSSNVSMYFADTAKLNQWQLVSGIATNKVNGIRIFVGSANALRTGEFNAANVICIDLTAIFGAGNEPTLAECDAMFETPPNLPTLNTIESISDTYDKVTDEYVKRISDWIELTGDKFVGVNGAGGLTGQRNFYTDAIYPSLNFKSVTYKYDGTLLGNYGSQGSIGYGMAYSSQMRLYISALMNDTGWSNALNVTTNEVRAYMNGYRMCHSDGSYPYYESKIAYNPATWAEWSNIIAGGTGVKDNTGYIVSMGAVGNYGKISINTSLKASTKYGILYNLAEYNMTNIWGVTGDAFNYQMLTAAVGNNKASLTTRSAITTNAFGFQCVAGTGITVAGQSYKVKDVRLFELPTGSQIEADFTNLTADELNEKYAFYGPCIKNWQKLVGDDASLTTIIPTTSYAEYTPYRMQYALATPQTSAYTANYYLGEYYNTLTKPNTETLHVTETKSVAANKKILEAFHLAETYWDNVNFALRILEAFAIQEGQHRNTTHSAKETLGVGEFTSKHDRKFTFENIVAQELNLKATTKKLSETLTTIDATTQIVNFLRTIAETLHVAEAPAQAVDFHRLFVEAAHMADSYKSSVNKELREIFSISQEQKFVDMDKLAKENVAIAEATHRNLATLRKETLHIAETYWDNIAFIVRCLENIHVGEVIHNTNTFKRTWNESVALNENAARINEFNRLWQEAFGTTEGYANAVQFIRKTYETLWVNEGPKKNTAKALQDAFAISDLAAKLVGKPLQEALRVTDKKSVNMAKLLQDTLHMVDFIDRNIAFIRKFFETFGTGDKISRNVETLLRENFSMADKVRNTYQKAVSENFAIASDTFSRQVDFKLKIEEIISSIEGVAMEYGLEINEAINLLDSYITNVKAVLSNIAIREGEMTLADFQDAIATPPGYNTFRDFVVGDYEYQKALMRIVINAPATSSQPVVKDVVPYVDIEDTDDKGEVTITQTTTATKVYFNKFYYNAPEVNVTLKGGSGVIIPNIVSTTGQDEGGRYFEVELLNSSGSRVTGTFSWTSKGY